MGAEVVAVAIDGLGVVDPDPRLRPLGESGEELDRPLGQRGGLRGDDHHLVADRLHDRRLGRQRRLHRLDEVLDHVQRLEVALLLGVAGEAGEVDEAERHRDLAEVSRGGAELALHVADHVLLEEEAQVAVVQVLGQRRRPPAARRLPAPPSPRPSPAPARRRGSSARARRGGRGAPRRRRCGASTARRRGRAAGRRRGGSRRQAPARSGATPRRRWGRAAARGRSGCRG